jgi:hypothetical protein
MRVSFFFFPMALPDHSGPRPFIQLRNHLLKSVGLLGRVISPLQGLYLNTGQHKQNKRIHTPNIHALSGIQTHDTNVRTNEDNLYLRPREHCDRLMAISPMQILGERSTGYFLIGLKFSVLTSIDHSVKTT